MHTHTRTQVCACMCTRVSEQESDLLLLIIRFCKEMMSDDSSICVAVSLMSAPYIVVEEYSILTISTTRYRMQCHLAIEIYTAI